MKAFLLVVALVMLGSGGAAAAEGGKVVPGRCVAVVDGKTAREGSCLIDLEVGGGFAIRETDLVSVLVHVVPDQTSGTASATWTPPPYQGKPRQLGPLKRDGACWIDAHTKLCAWSGEAEMLKNRNAPYTAFHALVGKDIRGGCSHGECVWFRYDKAELVDHNAHEALFKIREHSWFTDDDWERPSKPERMKSDVFYARCSRERPSFLNMRDGGVDFAPGTDAGRAGPFDAFYVEYAAACHGQTRAITGIAGVMLGYVADEVENMERTPRVDVRKALQPAREEQAPVE